MTQKKQWASLNVIGVFFQWQNGPKDLNLIKPNQTYVTKFIILKLYKTEGGVWIGFRWVLDYAGSFLLDFSLVFAWYSCWFWLFFFFCLLSTIFCWTYCFSLILMRDRLVVIPCHSLSFQLDFDLYRQKNYLLCDHWTPFD